jgi:predicted nucleotidyltransferase
MKDEWELGVHTHPPVLDEAGLVEFLATQPDIVAAYLFGSLAQGRATPRSDIDIAVLLTRVPDVLAGECDRQFQLMDDLRRFADRVVDVVILNSASIILQNQILRYGRRLYESDRRARVVFEVRSGQTYVDSKPMRDFFTKVLFTEIKKGGGLGGRRHHQD